MSYKDLKNKPLVEAIFELRYDLVQQTKDILVDPHYKILVGKIFDRVEKQYPFYEKLNTASIPDEIAAYVVQHRFRKGKGEWPLIQFGPGVITLNEAAGYKWTDFHEKIKSIINVLYSSYPGSSLLKPNALLLRYIDAINFNYNKDKIFDFLKEKMKINIGIHKKLFENTGVNNMPVRFDMGFAFPCEKPKGAISMRFGRGTRDNESALLWETQVESRGIDVPQKLDDILSWSNQAHILTDNWFFQITEGDLQRRFE